MMHSENTERLRLALQELGRAEVKFREVLAEMETRRPAEQLAHDAERGESRRMMVRLEKVRKRHKYRARFL